MLCLAATPHEFNHPILLFVATLAAFEAKHGQAEFSFELQTPTQISSIVIDYPAIVNAGDSPFEPSILANGDDAQEEVANVNDVIIKSSVLRLMGEYETLQRAQLICS